MAIKRYTASADTTITNAYEANLSTRGTGSNMGYADSLEVFSIYGQLSGSSGSVYPGQSQELSRTLIKFPTTTIAADRTAGTIPASGSVNFYLKMFNAETPFTLPQDFTLDIIPISSSWTEGVGLDMDSYQDPGAANWLSSSTTTAWTNIGGDYRSGSDFAGYTKTFALGYEDIETDVTHLVERWMQTSGTALHFDNYGVGIKLDPTQEAYYSSSDGLNTAYGNALDNLNGSTDSYYTKKFFARSTEFFFKRPVIEARWDNRVKDNRENFYYSSSFAPLIDNLNTLYMYNYVRGQLTNLPGVGTGLLNISFYSSSAGIATASALLLAAGGNVASALDTNATGGWASTGIYSCSVSMTAATTRLLAVNDVWHTASEPAGTPAIQFYTGSIYPELMPTYAAAPTFNRVTSCKNLKKSYSQSDKARFRFFVRNRNWNPTIYTKAIQNNPTDIIVSASYSVVRVTDNYSAIGYGTGSDYSTYLSYDNDGNYFDLDMSLLERGYMYEIKLSYYNNSIGAWQEQPQTFKFRVDE